jgi:protein-S-isoprenylcysteine O-methyltransferase Ste14
MTLSSSTPRIRFMQAWYLLVLVLVALSGGRWFNGWVGVKVTLLGLVLIAAAALGRIWTSVHIAGRKDEQLVTFGPYSRCRHPLYALSILGGLGVGLATRSLLITAATLLVMSVLHLRAIRAEERFLLERHGEKFKDYCRDVPMLWPRHSGFKNPETTTINLPVFWKAFLDAGSFVAIFVLIQLLDALRTTGFWPTLFDLW